MKKEKATTPAEPKESAEVEAVAETGQEKAVKTTKVGAMLKDVRQKKGLKLTDIAKTLCIRKFYLEAIEANHYNEIPAFPYGIGFIRSYANFLGLNGENIVELYKEETNAAEPQDIRVLEPQPEASMPSIQYLLISLLAITAVYAGWAFFSKTDDALLEETSIIDQDSANSEEAGVIVVEEFNFEPPAEEISAETTETKEADNSSKQITVSDSSYQEPQKETLTPVETPKVSTSSQTTSQIKSQPIIPSEGVFIEVLEETWIEVKDETKLYLSKVLQAGDTYKVPEGKGKVLSFGKFDGAKVYVNGVLTQVAKPSKKTNIELDKFLEANR